MYFILLYNLVSELVSLCCKLYMSETDIIIIIINEAQHTGALKLSERLASNAHCEVRYQRQTELGVGRHGGVLRVGAEEREWQVGDEVDDASSRRARTRCNSTSYSL